MKRIVLRFNIDISFLACLTTSLTSATPQVQADILTNLSFPLLRSAMMLARLVLPQPGGPHRIKLGMAEEEEDQRALHAKIFGDDDSDAEDEEYVAPVEEMSGKKRLQKTKPSSSKKRRSAPDADTMAAEGARLEAESDARKRPKEKKGDEGEGEGGEGDKGAMGPKPDRKSVV